MLHRMRLRAIGCLVVLLGATGACRDASDAGSRPEDPTLERGRRMLERAAACEASAAGAGPPAAAPCGEACDLGHSNSCARAGDAARAAGDPRRAAALHRRACDGGSGLGCEAADDPARARLHYRTHCEQHHAASCLRLGRLHAAGAGGPADPGAAVTFLRRACALGLAEACEAQPTDDPPAPAPRPPN